MRSEAETVGQYLPAQKNYMAVYLAGIYTSGKHRAVAKKAGAVRKRKGKGVKK